MSTLTASQGPRVLLLSGDEHSLVDPRHVLDQVSRASRVAPFDNSRIEFLADYSGRLSRAFRGQGDLQALAHFLRRSETMRMSSEFALISPPDAPLMPRGVVFHIPPSNVGTIFVYSLALALITGNASVVRMSSRALLGSNPALDTLHATLRDHPHVAGSVLLVSYDHDDATTELLSRGADVRVIWGGDATVNRVRAAPLSPFGRDITFPDRHSFAVISTGAYGVLGPDDRDLLAEKFFNDTFWFDQMGCSSPRVLVWAGPELHSELAADFHERVAAVIQRKAYATDVATEVSKLNFAYRSALDQPVVGFGRYGIVDTVLETDGFAPLRGEFCGGGLVHQCQIDDLEELVAHLGRKDQTIAVFGVHVDSLRKLVQQLAGRGVDRIVPFGTALNFGRFWDGYDLLAEFTRRTVIDVR